MVNSNIVCPHCNKEVKVDSYGTFKCPLCKGSFSISDNGDILKIASSSKKTLIIVFLIIGFLLLCCVSTAVLGMLLPPSLSTSNPKATSINSNDPTISIKLMCSKIESVSLNQKNLSTSELSELCNSTKGLEITLIDGENILLFEGKDSEGKIYKVTYTVNFDESSYKAKIEAEAKAKAEAEAENKAKAEAEAKAKAEAEAEAKAKAEAEAKYNSLPTEYKSALKKAQSYSDTMHMSKRGLYDQLVSEYGEQFSAEAAQYAIDNVVADWNLNALYKAKSYQNTMNMSPAAIHDQLTSEYGEKFTQSEADYAISHLND